MMNQTVECELRENFLRHFMRDRQRIYHFVYSLAMNEADADDVFQRVSIILWQRFDRFDQDRVFYPWACKIAAREFQNFRRSAYRRRLMLLGDELVSELTDQQKCMSQRSPHRENALQESLSRISHEDRDLIRMVYEEGVPVELVARQRGRAIQTIYNRLQLIRKTLLQSVHRLEETPNMLPRNSCNTKS